VKRLAVAAVVLVVVWIGGLIVSDYVLERSIRARVADRIGESLRATATIASGDLALVRGHEDLAGLSVVRDEPIGHLSLQVDEIRCELPPLGFALFDRSCGELAVRGVHLSVSAAALFSFPRPKRPPMRARSVVIDDATFDFAPSAFVPDLGRVSIRIDHAEAGPTVFKTPLSWLFALRELRATLSLPAGIGLALEYRAGTLTAAGSVLGSAPVTIPVSLPVVTLADDARDELRALGSFGKDIAERLVAEKATDWLRSKLGG
jgi:hypothetical protein